MYHACAVYNETISYIKNLLSDQSSNPEKDVITLIPDTAPKRAFLEIARLRIRDNPTTSEFTASTPCCTNKNLATLAGRLKKHSQR
jgi:hypothetical protein